MANKVRKSHRHTTPEPTTSQQKRINYKRNEPLARRHTVAETAGLPNHMNHAFAHAIASLLHIRRPGPTASHTTPHHTTPQTHIGQRFSQNRIHHQHRIQLNPGADTNTLRNQNTYTPNERWPRFICFINNDDLHGVHSVPARAHTFTPGAENIWVSGAHTRTAATLFGLSDSSTTHTSSSSSKQAEDGAREGRCKVVKGINVSRFYARHWVLSRAVYSASFLLLLLLLPERRQRKR